MATATTHNPAGVDRRVGVLRLLITGGVTAVAAFALCWLGTFVPFSSPTHAYITLFTIAPVNSLAALAQGGVWSALFGALAGGLFAVVYNWTAKLHR